MLGGIGSPMIPSSLKTSLIIPSSSSSHPSKRSSRSLSLSASLPKYPPASKIFIRNLSYSTTESSLIKAFSRFGKILDFELVKDEGTKKSKGYGFIQYPCLDDAILAIEGMDHKNLDGRVVSVEIAKIKRNSFGAYPVASGPPVQPRS
ncbi:hypothetical protein QJS10_CPA01g00811 [Acorus calamus]|uniref:RRM domain-containing protein n=1 Tax=Acorus calamus TaxID=4465 RepID=A0AAV9FMT9_ACOCL|nr:hypothetical protein QJS10_CPA01g00811 [Acorus calamus]